MTNKKVPEHVTQFEIFIEPKFVPGEGFINAKFRAVTINVFARDIYEAMEKAKAIINLSEDEAEITSAIGNSYYMSPYRNRKND